jgi:hypothetical protein
MKKNRGDEPIEVIIHIYIHGNHKEAPCVVAIFISNKQKYRFFLLQNQRTEGWNRSLGGGMAPMGRGRWQGKGIGG